jgi:chromosome segregation ATPase
MTALSTTPPLEEREAVARTIPIEMAKVYRAGGRRWLTLEAACRAAAKEKLREKYGRDWASDEGEIGTIKAMNLLARVARRYVITHRQNAASTAPLRTENETLRAEREQSEKHRNDLMDSIVSLKTERGALRTRLAAVEAERDAAIARAEEAERRLTFGETTDESVLRNAFATGAQWAEKKALPEAAALTTKLAKAEGEIATMRAALDNSQSLLVMIREIAPTDAGWREEGVPALLQDQISSNRAALTTPEHPHGD